MIDFTIASASTNDAVAAARACSQELTALPLSRKPQHEHVALVFVCQSMAGDMDRAVALLRDTLDLSYINLSVNQLVLSQIAPEQNVHGKEGGAVGPGSRQGCMAVLLMTVERGSVFHMTLSSEQIQALSETDLRQGYLAQFQEQAQQWLHHNYPAMGVIQSDLGVLPIDDLVLDLQTDFPAHFCGNTGLSQDRGFSCLLFSGRAELAAAVTQSCDPIGPVHDVEDASENVLIDLDAMSPLRCLQQDMNDFNEEEAQTKRGLLEDFQDIFCARRVYNEEGRPFSLLDFVVRPIQSIEPETGSITLPLTENMDMGEEIIFCHRSPEVAEKNMHEMLETLKHRSGKLPKAGLYVACFARTVHLFPSPEYEYDLIRAYFPEMPLICAWGQGQISQGNLYQQTGCLTLFF